MNTDLRCTLVTEDAECVAALAAMLAGHTGPARIDVHGARPRDVAAHLREQTVHVLVLDLERSGEEPLAAYGRLQALAPELPVVLLASAETEAVALGVVRQGASDYLLREQVQAAYLASTLRHAVQRARQERALGEAQAQLTRALRDSEASYRALFDNIAEFVSIVDADGRLVNVNRAVLEGYDYTREELIGRTPMILADPERTDASRMAPRLQAALRGEPQSLQWWARRKDGSTFPKEVTLTRAEYFGRDVVIAVSRDVTDRITAEARLQQAYDQLTAFLDSLPDVAWLKDAEGRFVVVNRAYTRVVGQTAGAIIGRTTTELFPAEVAEGFRASDERALREGQYVAEEEVRHGDGTQRWYETTRAPIRGQDGAVAGLVGIAHDISNRRRMEQALRSTHDRLQQILAASPIVPYTLRISADGSDRSVWVSANVHMVLGYEEEETQQPEWWLAGIHPDDRMAVADWMDRLLRDGRLCHEYRFRHRDGSYRWVRDDLTLMCRDSAGTLEIVGTWTDTTERREAEFAVSRSRDYYHSLLDGLPALVWRSDAEGACDYFNATWLEFTGRTLQEESGNGWLEGVHPEDRERCLAIYRAAIAACEPFEIEYRLRHRGGEYRWVLDVGRPLYDGDGAFQGLIGGAIDLEAQRQLEAQLRMAQKMEAVGRLAGGVAHDFNNLLTAVTANAALLLQDLAIGDPARENVSEIADAAERAAALTRHLLAFSRKQVLQPRILDLNEVLARTHPILRRLIGEDVVIDVRLEPQLARTKADPSQIEQVILNLAINARDSMPQGGDLRFRTQNLVVGPESRPQPYVHPGRYVALVVEDTGFGMDEATRVNIFEPFFTTKPTGEGTGLGLSTAYGIVKQSDGYIWAQSEPGRGSTFTVLLPQAEDVPAAPMVDASSAGRPLGGRETVLLVEDESLVRRAARRILQRGGYAVLEAESGAQALHLAREAVQPIHLLLTDVVMPVLGGRELADQVVALHPEARVIFMSGYTRGSIAQRGVLEPGTILLEKPFAPEALTQVVRQALDGRPHSPSR